MLHTHHQQRFMIDGDLPGRIQLEGAVKTIVLVFIVPDGTAGGGVF